MGARFYKTFSDIFVPRMFEVASECFESGSIFPDWAVGLINSIPKSTGTPSVGRLRPIALQDVKKKWIMNIVCLMVEQIFQRLTHRRQVGCVKGRHMINHIWAARSGWEGMRSGVLVSFDFSNAFPTLTHNFITAVLRLIELPECIISFILLTLTAPYHFYVGRGVVREVVFHPAAGIGQGDPFSPVLFSFCVSFVLFGFDSLMHVQAYMYADDLGALIQGRHVSSIVYDVLEMMKQFGIFSGLLLNLGKCGIVVKGNLSTRDQQLGSLDSWGVTLRELAQHPECGGFQLPTPKCWLHAQFGLSFHKFLQHPEVFTETVTSPFRTWCAKYGVCLHAWAWPYIQLGPVPYKTFGYLAYSLKSFSIARRYILDGLADPTAQGQLPLWHSAVFKNAKQLTYYCPVLIKKSILTVQDLYGLDGRIPAHLLSKIAPTWKVVYEVGLANFMHHQPTDWSPPSVWVGAWAKTDTLKRLAPDPETVTRHSPAVWKAFWRSKLPPSIVDFVHQVLWRKLKVAERLSPWTQDSRCPVCGTTETIDHALNSCRFHIIIFDTLDKCWDTVVADNKPHAARSLPLQTTFSTPLGIMMWTALAAHWSFRNSLIRGGIGSYDGFLSVWIKFVALLAVWEPISRYSDVFWQFHKSLSHLLTQGSLITTKICFEPSEHEREERARKRSKKMERKHELAVLAREEIASLQQQGYVVVYTDGSAEWVQQVGWVGGVWML